MVRRVPGGWLLMSRRTIANLVFFVIVFFVMCAWAASNIITIDQIDNPYPIKGEFSAASGVTPNAEVAYLGVHYGRVSSVERIPGGVRMTMKIDDGKQIPKGSIARIFRKSAIGEPYIDFKPPEGYKDGGPYIGKNDTVPVSQTQVPLEFSELLRAANALLANVDPNKAGDLVHELATALNGRTDDLRSLTNSFDQLTQTFVAKSDVLDRLATNNTAITKVLADHATDFGQSLTNLRLLADSLASSTGDTSYVLDNGSRLVGELANLVSDEKAPLDCTLKSLTDVIGMTVSRLPGTEYILRNGPDADSKFYSTRDEMPDGLWVRVNLLVDPSNPSEQYNPPLLLPPHRDVPACSSQVASGGGQSFVPADALAASRIPSGTSLPATGGALFAALSGILLAMTAGVRILTTRARAR
jgi:phospholipid/cholesterol/gamma-HCH transport system substrate-binding protein